MSHSPTQRLHFFLDKILTPALLLATAWRLYLVSARDGRLAVALTWAILVSGFLWTSRQAHASRATPFSILGLILAYGSPMLFDWRLPSAELSRLAWAAAAIYYGLFIVTAYLTLGRSLSVLPAVRVVKSTGPYRFVRHPIYAGYGHLFLAYVLTSPSSQNMVAFAGVALGLWIRLTEEEALLQQTASYDSYRERVGHAVFAPALLPPLLFVVGCAVYMLAQRRQYSLF